jgi:hypothetical protein
MSEQEATPEELPAHTRARQEREVALSHALTRAEYALASEGAEIGRTLGSAGLEFDARTFVAIRVLETSVAEDMDPVDALTSVELRDLIERSAELTDGLIAGRAND